MAHGNRYLLSLLAVMLACASPIAPDAAGTWGGSAASMVLGADGGSVTYLCGSGTIAAGWTLTSGGTFTATGQHYYGGGPEPLGGRTPHPATYTGQIDGSRMKLTVRVTDSGSTLGPFELVKGGPPVSQICV